MRLDSSIEHYDELTLAKTARVAKTSLSSADRIIAAKVSVPDSPTF